MSQSRNCTPDSPEWATGCAFEPCGPAGRCWSVGSTVGYCTFACETDDDCAGAQGGPWGSEFTCVFSEQNGGLCMPGSNTPCTTDEQCAGAEVCKVGAVIGEDGRLGYGLACQPPTMGGASIGQACNIDPTDGPLTLCRHDLCYGKVCAAPCSGGGDGRCGGPPMSCQAQWTYSDFYASGGDVTGSFCGAATCNGQSDCNNTRYSCVPVQMGSGSSEVIGGWCVAESDDFGVIDLAELGEPCDTSDDTPEEDQIFCRSRFCAPTARGSYCSARCNSDVECGAGQLCIADVVGLSETRTVAWSICRNVPGSQQVCQRDSDCGGGEVCNLYYRGQTSDDGRLVNGTTQGRCTQPVEGGSSVGGLCSGDRVCDHEGMCFNAQNNPNPFCSAPCTADGDCPGSMICVQGNIWDNNTPGNDGDDLIINICVPDGL